MTNVQTPACRDHACLRRMTSNRGFCARHEALHSRLDNCFAMVAEMTERLEAFVDSRAAVAPPVDAEDFPEVLTVAEVAALLRRSESDVFDDIMDGRFPIQRARDAGRNRFAKGDVLRFLNGG